MHKQDNHTNETVGEHLEALYKSESSLLLVVQGGGMRGVISMAVLKAWHELGITADFFTDGIYGSSAGYDNGIHYAIARHICAEDTPVIDQSVRAYTEFLATRRFMNLGRIATRPFGGRPAADIDYLASKVFRRMNPDLQHVLQEHPEVFAGVTNAETGELEFISSRDPTVDSFDLTRATAALPILYGRQVQLGGKEYVDGGAKRTLPVHEAVDHARSRGRLAKNICIIGTRAVGHSNSGIPRMAHPFVRWPLMHGESKAVKKAVCTSDSGGYNNTMSRLGEIKSLDGMFMWQPSSTDLTVSRLCIDREQLEKCAQQAADNAKRFLDTQLRQIGGILVPATVALNPQ